MNVTIPLCLPMKLHGLMLAPRALCPFQGGVTIDVAPDAQFPPFRRVFLDLGEDALANIEIRVFTKLGFQADSISCAISFEPKPAVESGGTPHKMKSREIQKL